MKKLISKNQNYSLNWLLLLPVIIVQLFSSCGSDSGDQSKGAPDIDNLIAGKLAYDIPDTMRVGNTYRVIVSITKALNDSILFLNLDSSEFESEEIKVSSKVKVSLMDPSNDNNFAIQPLNTEEQLVDAASNTTWFWNVSPLRSGENELLLRATVKVISDLGETPRDIPVFEKKITVQASPLHSIKQFIGDNWQWLAGTILIPFLIWTYKNRKEKR